LITKFKGEQKRAPAAAVAEQDPHPLAAGPGLAEAAAADGGDKTAATAFANEFLMTAKTKRSTPKPTPSPSPPTSPPSPPKEEATAGDRDQRHQQGQAADDEKVVSGGGGDDDVGVGFKKPSESAAALPTLPIVVAFGGGGPPDGASTPPIPPPSAAAGLDLDGLAALGSGHLPQPPAADEGEEPISLLHLRGVDPARHGQVDGGTAGLPTVPVAVAFGGGGGGLAALRNGHLHQAEEEAEANQEQIRLPLRGVDPGHPGQDGTSDGGCAATATKAYTFSPHFLFVFTGYLENSLFFSF
jgi:hypothetical protein